VKAYQTRNGATQYKPTFKWAEKAADQNKGFCLACGKTQSVVEPDARRYACTHCKKEKVYGAEELVVMGLVY